MLRQKRNPIFDTGRKTPIFLTAIILIIAIFSCEKKFDKEEFYKEAKEKHKFFRCKVNGEEWHTAGHGYFGNMSTMAYYTYSYDPKYSGTFEANIDNKPNDNKNENMYIYIENDLEEGDNEIKQVGTRYIYTNFINSPWKIYYIDSTYNNNLYITDIDSTNKIITGQFEFRAMTEDGQDTVLVTDGEFDWAVYWYE